MALISRMSLSIHHWIASLVSFHTGIESSWGSFWTVWQEDRRGFSPMEHMPPAGSGVPVNSPILVLGQMSLSIFSVAGWTVPSVRLKLIPTKFSCWVEFNSDLSQLMRQPNFWHRRSVSCLSWTDFSLDHCLWSQSSRYWWMAIFSPENNCQLFKDLGEEPWGWWDSKRKCFKLKHFFFHTDF